MCYSIKKTSIALLFFCSWLKAQEVKDPFEGKVLALPHELQLQVFRSQDIGKITIYKAWRLLGCFNKLATRYSYNQQDKDFIEKLAIKVNLIYPKLSGRCCDLYQLHPIAGLYTLNHLSHVTKKLVYEIAYYHSFFSPFTLAYPDQHNFFPNNPQPEQLYASLVHAIFDQINDFFIHRQGRQSLLCKDSWILSGYLFEVRKVMRKQNLLISYFDIENSREYINEKRIHHGLEPLSTHKKNKICTII